MQSILVRQQALREILAQGPVFSQEELIQKLNDRGITATQATLSRDLKSMNIIKVSGKGYCLSPARRPSASSLGLGIMSIEFSGPIAVIKTHVGFAPAVATFLDRNPLHPIMGTLAGDDTVMLALRSSYTENQVLKALSSVFPNIWENVIHPAFEVDDE